MAHSFQIPHSDRAQLSNAIVVTILAVVALLLTALVIVDVQANAPTQQETAQPEIEDWHGNVRRSLGVN